MQMIIMIDYKSNLNISVGECGDHTYGLSHGFQYNDVYSRNVRIDPKAYDGKDGPKTKKVTLHEIVHHINPDASEDVVRQLTSSLARDMGMADITIAEMDLPSREMRQQKYYSAYNNQQYKYWSNHSKT